MSNKQVLIENLTIMANHVSDYAQSSYLTDDQADRIIDAIEATIKELVNTPK